MILSVILSPHSQWLLFSWSRRHHVNQRIPSWWQRPYLPSPARTPHVYHQACQKRDQTWPQQHGLYYIWDNKSKSPTKRLPFSFSRADEELGAICVRPWICHWEGSCRDQNPQLNVTQSTRSWPLSTIEPITLWPGLWHKLTTVFGESLFTFSESDANCDYATFGTEAPNNQHVNKVYTRKELFWLVHAVSLKKKSRSFTWGLQKPYNRWWMKLGTVI